MSWTCSCCGEVHEGLPTDWAFDAPTYWEGPRAPGDELTSSFCVWTDDEGTRCYFVRGVLHLPVLDDERTLGYGVWSSLSERSYERVVELWDDPARVHEEPYFGWLSNALPGYPDTVNLPLDVLTPELDLRPTFVLHDGDHPLVREQRDGITEARLREIAEQHLHGLG